MRAGYFATDAAELNNLATCQIVSIVFILMGLSADKTLHAMEYMKNKEMMLQHKYKYRRSNADMVETETTNRGSDNPASEVSIAGAGV